MGPRLMTVRELPGPGSMALSLAIVGLSAALFGLTQPPTSAWPLGYVCLVPWLVVSTRVRIGSAAALGLLFGTIGGVWVVSWIQPTLLSVETPTLSAAAAPILVSAWCGGVPFALVGVAAATGRRWAPTARILVIAASVLTVDLARSHTSFGVPWALLGHSQWLQPGIAQLAVVGGVPLISALLTGVNAALAEILRPVATSPERRQAFWCAGAFAGACVACLVLGEPLARLARESMEGPRAPSVSLLAIQTNLLASARWDPDLQRSNIESLRALTERELERLGTQPALVVWPESVTTTAIDKRRALAEQVNSVADGLGVPLVLGALRSAPSRRPAFYRNSVLWIEPHGGIVADFDKTRAVPFVESNPGFPGASYLGEFLGNLPHGPRIEEMRADGPLRGTFELAIVLCYESIFPELVQDRRSPETLAVLNLANDSWLQSKSASLQEIAYTSFRAIEQRLPLVRVTDGGISASIDPYGRVLATVPFGTEGGLLIPVFRESTPTVRERVVLSLLVVTGGGIGGGFAATLWRKPR